MKNVAKWLKVALATTAVFWVLAMFLAPIGDAMQSVGAAVGKVAPAVGTGLRTSSRTVHNTVCERSDKCSVWSGP